MIRKMAISSTTKTNSNISRRRVGFNLSQSKIRIQRKIFPLLRSTMPKKISRNFRCLTFLIKTNSTFWMNLKGCSLLSKRESMRGWTEWRRGFKIWKHRIIKTARLLPSKAKRLKWWLRARCKKAQRAWCSIKGQAKANIHTPRGKA